MFQNIKSSENWAFAEPLNKGWSSDKKYFVKTKAGENLLLRLSDIEKYDEKRKEHEIISKFAKLGFPMSAPNEFGVCNDNKSVYMLLSWLDGVDLGTVLPDLSREEQYRLGRQAGIILKKIHSLPLAAEDIPVKTKKEKKLWQLSLYEQSNHRTANDESAIRYVKENIDLIWRKPPVYTHGDFHQGNLIYMQKGLIGVIDFNRWEVSDPYEEFCRLESFGIESSVDYCIGQIDAYFDDEVPADFWAANAVYAAQTALCSITWAEKFGQEEIEAMQRRAQRAFDDFDCFRRIIPKWYAERH